MIAPSRFVADLARRYFPGIRVDVIAHGALPVEPAPQGARQVVLIPDDDWPTVAILGAIGPDKGARRVEHLASLAARRGLGLRFVVIGYLDRHAQAWQSEDTRLTVNGHYDARHLRALLDYYRPRLVLFPSAGPESFSYTLSEAWSAGYPVLVPPIGALAERVTDQGAGWVMSEAEWRDDGVLLERVLALLAPQANAALREAGARAARLPLPDLAGQAAATVERYELALADRPPLRAPLDRRRLVEAMGYRRWTPPPGPEDGALAAGGRAAARAREGSNPASPASRSIWSRTLDRLFGKGTAQRLKARARP